jgi:hypothetical protein
MFQLLVSYFARETCLNDTTLHQLVESHMSLSILCPPATAEIRRAIMKDGRGEDHTQQLELLATLVQEALQA